MKRAEPLSASSAVLTYREIADLLGVSHGTVQNIERRALEKMRREAVRLGLDFTP